VDRDDGRNLSTYCKQLRQYSAELRALAPDQRRVAAALLETIRACLDIRADRPRSDSVSSDLIDVGPGGAYQVPRVLPLHHAGSTGPGSVRNAAVAGDRERD
jgi:hypothetical protein